MGTRQPGSTHLSEASSTSAPASASGTWTGSRTRSRAASWSTSMEQTEHQLSPGEVKLLGEYEAAIRGLFVKYAEAICDLNAQKLGAIHCMIRHAGLEGTWNLDLAG